MPAVIKYEIISVWFNSDRDYHDHDIHIKPGFDNHSSEYNYYFVNLLEKGGGGGGKNDNFQINFTLIHVVCVA